MQTSCRGLKKFYHCCYEVLHSNNKRYLSLNNKVDRFLVVVCVFRMSVHFLPKLWLNNTGKTVLICEVKCSLLLI